jgi:hypothetical protein
MKATLLSLVGLAVVSLGAMGCASTPAAPFNTMANAQVTALHLQNNQPPPAAAATIPGASMLPPQLQTIITGATAALPGLGSLPFPIPGLGGATGTAPAAQPQQNLFQGYPIIKANQLVDQSVREQLAKIFGDPDNFDNGGAPCMYPEMGVGWAAQMGAPNNEMLISFTCRQVEARTFAWPHPGRSMKPKTIQKLADLMPQLLP